MELQDLYERAIDFAGKKHGDQKMPGSRASYLVHLSNVAMEIILALGSDPAPDLNFGVQVALLHDVLEDTPTTYSELKANFGARIADAVLALSKNENLQPSRQIPDSLDRIKRQPKTVWAVKLADRISNMQEPPAHWDNNKRIDYRRMANIILNELKGGNTFLEKRLEKKIRDYERYIE